MIVFRSIRNSDLDALFSLARSVGIGMTTLKADRSALEDRIAVAQASFSGTIDSRLADYMFVLEDTESNQVVGVSAVKASVGLDEPFYSYRVCRLVHSSPKLDIYSQKETLILTNDLTGAAELCTLYLNPEFRGGTNGKLLSKGRLMFASNFIHLLPELIFAEMRGYQRSDGTSPFWDSLGKHFFKMDFGKADDMSSVGTKSFIAELMPRFPIYTDFLTEDAREYIGAVHSATAPAKRLLEQEGLNFEGLVDIFDAGPVLQGHVSQLRITQDSELAIARQGSEQHSDEATSGRRPMMVSNTLCKDFRVIVSYAEPQFGSIALGREELAALGIEPGDPVRVVAMNGQEIRSKST